MRKTYVIVIYIFDAALLLPCAVKSQLDSVNIFGSDFSVSILHINGEGSLLNAGEILRTLSPARLLPSSADITGRLLFSTLILVKSDFHNRGPPLQSGIRFHSQ